MSELAIRLTQVELTDKTAIRALYDNGFSKYWDRNDLFDPYNIENELSKILSDDHRRLFVIRASRTNSSGPSKLYVVGICGFVEIDWISRHAKLVFLMVDKGGHAATIQNYPATRSAFSNMLDYGFKELGLNKIWMEIQEHNNVKESLEMFGFIPEGVRVDSYWNEGQYYNTIICSITLAEYNKRE